MRHFWVSCKDRNEDLRFSDHFHFLCFRCIFLRFDDILHLIESPIFFPGVNISRSFTAIHLGESVRGLTLCNNERSKKKLAVGDRRDPLLQLLLDGYKKALL